MSKYEPLWKWIKLNGTESFMLTFTEVENIIGFKIDHSFLKYKKELLDYAFMVQKISMKDNAILFKKIK